MKKIIGFFMLTAVAFTVALAGESHALGGVEQITTTEKASEVTTQKPIEAETKAVVETTTQKIETTTKKTDTKSGVGTTKPATSSFALFCPCQCRRHITLTEQQAVPFFKILF